MNTSMSDEVRRGALALLHGRHSVGPKHLSPPGPTAAELRAVFAAALRGPDHRKLVPFRFVVIEGAGLERLAELFVDYGRRCGKSGEELEMERTRATQAPTVLAVVARIRDAVEVPAHEQWIAVGGAITNALNALHFMGFGAKMLSGLRAADAAIAKAFCAEGETLVGWISVGTAKSGLKARETVPVEQVFSNY